MKKSMKSRKQGNCTVPPKGPFLGQAAELAMPNAPRPEIGEGQEGRAEHFGGRLPHLQPDLVFGVLAKDEGKSREAIIRRETKDATYCLSEQVANTVARMRSTSTR